ncbi:MAG: LysE family transporter [Umezawaea sp.]
MPQQLIPFLLVAAVLTVTPGPDMALVLRNGVRGGVRLAWWTGLGCCAGIAVHATAAVLAAVFLGVAVVWWRVFTLLISALSRVLSKQRVRTTFERVTGVVLVALGVRVALEGV